MMESKDYNEQTQATLNHWRRMRKTAYTEKSQTGSILHRSLPIADKSRGVPFPALRPRQTTPRTPVTHKEHVSKFHQEQDM
jgi:hypothetical protein